MSVFFSKRRAAAAKAAAAKGLPHNKAESFTVTEPAPPPQVEPAAPEVAAAPVAEVPRDKPLEGDSETLRDDAPLATPKIPANWQQLSRTKRGNLARKIDPNFAGDESAANQLIAQELAKGST